MNTLLRNLKMLYSCSSCNNLLDNPMISIDCGHLLCEKCIRIKIRCSVCKKSKKESFVLDDLTRTIIEQFGRLHELSCNTKKFDDAQPSAIEVDYEQFAQRIVLCDVSPRNRMGETPSHVCCKNDRDKELRALIADGADINACDFANWTPLHEAIECGSYNCAKLLLDNGADINCCGGNYQTASHKAVIKQDARIMELLLQYGADVNLLDIYGRKPIDYCDDETVRNMLIHIKPTIHIVQKVFVPTKIIVYSSILPLSTKHKLIRRKLSFVASVAEFLHKEDVNCYVMNADAGMNEHAFLIAMLKGVFIVRDTWPNRYLVDSSKHHPCREVIFNEHVHTAIYNRLHQRPRLFDGMSFCIRGYSSPYKTDLYVLTKDDIEHLIVRGGGKVSRSLSRKPATVARYAYHCAGNVQLRRFTGCLVITDSEGNVPNPLDSVQYRSAQWLIDCILNFKIL